MKRLLLAILFSSTSQFALADEQALSEESAITYLNQSCLKNIERMLIGFSIPFRPLQNDVSMTCGCMEESLRGKSWESQRQLDQALISSGFSCAKPIAHAYSKRAHKTRMGPLLAVHKWSPSQLEVYLDCFADGLWALSTEREQSRREALQAAAGNLPKDCEAKAGQ